MAEFDGDIGSQVASYVHGAAVDELLVCTNGNGTCYYHHDAIGSTVALTNTNGQMVEQYSYDVFGQPILKNATGTVIADSAYGNRFLFTNREWLASVGVYDYRNRSYLPSEGKFMQVDPLRFYGGDIDLYRYVHNNPTNLIDPTGLCPKDNRGVPKCKKDCLKYWDDYEKSALSKMKMVSWLNFGNAIASVLGGCEVNTGPVRRFPGMEQGAINEGQIQKF